MGQSADWALILTGARIKNELARVSAFVVRKIACDVGLFPKTLSCRAMLIPSPISIGLPLTSSALGQASVSAGGRGQFSRHLYFSFDNVVPLGLMLKTASHTYTTLHRHTVLARSMIW